MTSATIVEPVKEAIVNRTLSAARDLIAAGISLIPSGPDKLPKFDFLPRNQETGKPEWGEFQEHFANPDQLEKWFGGKTARAGIARVHGRISGNLETLDFDPHNQDEMAFIGQWRKLIDELEPGLLGKLTEIDTPRPGTQFVWRCEDPVEGNQILAEGLRPEAIAAGKTQESASGKDWHTVIETRGEGGYAVTPGTEARFHPNNREYEHVAGPPLTDVSVITSSERAVLLQAAKVFNKKPDKPPVNPFTGAHQKINGTVTVWDDFNNRTTWAEILEPRGWTLVNHTGEVCYWKRPGGESRWSATTNYNGNDLFHSFSTSTGQEHNKSVSRFAFVVNDEYGGDFKAATKALGAKGYGTPLKPDMRDYGLDGEPGNNGSTNGAAPPPHDDGPPPGAGPRPKTWLEPKPLPSGIPDVMSFECDLLPWSFIDWQKDIADRTQAPIDFSAAAAMVALSSVIGAKIAIRPKVHDDWTVIPNLWGMAVGRPGVMKSQAIQEAYRQLTRLEIDAGKEYEEAVREFAAQAMIAECRKKAAQSAVTKALKEGDPNLAKELAQKAVDDELKEPERRRYIVSDCTVEKMGVILKENPRGIAQLRDELLGLLKQLDKEGQEGLRSFLLEGWNGNGRFTFDRIARGTITCNTITISIFGGIQPGPLGDYQRAAARNGAEADGLLQRFQLAVYPDISSEWVNVDRWPDTNAKRTAYSVFTQLDKLDPIAIGAQTDEHDPDGVPFLRFDEDAQHAFNEWRGSLEERLRNGAEHPAIVSHLGKYRSLIPSLALLIHLAESHSGPVGLDPLSKALGWARYLESHARRIFASAVGEDMQGAKALADKLQEGALKDGFAPREVYRHGWSGLTTKEDAEESIALLCDLDWIRESPNSGTKRQRYDVNPNVRTQR